MKKAGERFLFWLVVVIILTVSLYGVYRAVSTPVDIPLPSEFSEDDWVKGNPEASVTLIEYSDFQCPACVRYYELVNEVIAEFGSHIKFTYRHFPLKSIHNKAALAAQATEAAGIQNHFWEMYELVFENQKLWSPMSVEDAENEFIKYAADLDLNQKQFINDLNSKKVISIVEAEYRSAVEGGLNSTPSFFLNGEKIQNPRSLDDFRLLIRQALEEIDT